MNDILTMKNVVMTNIGAIWVAQMFAQENGVKEIEYAAIGSGDGTFTDPENPPREDIAAEILKSEIARLHYFEVDPIKYFPGKCYLEEIEEGSIKIKGVNYAVSTEPTNLLLYSFAFDKYSYSGTIKEWGLFASIADRTAGEDANTGIMVYTKDVPDFPIEGYEQESFIIRLLLAG